MIVKSCIFLTAIYFPTENNAPAIFPSKFNLTQKNETIIKQRSTLEYNYITTEEFIEKLILDNQDILP